MPTFDEAGNIVADPGGFDTPPHYIPPPAAVGAEGSFGAAVFAFFHPGQVQQEYIAVGKAPPSIEEIQAGAVADMETHAGQGVRDMITTGKWIALGIGVLAVVYLVREVTKGRG